MRRELLERHVRPVVEEAFAADPVFMDDVVRALFKAPMFVWGNLKVEQLRALHRAALLVRLQGGA